MKLSAFSDFCSSIGLNIFYVDLTLVSTLAKHLSVKKIIRKSINQTLTLTKFISNQSMPVMGGQLLENRSSPVFPETSPLSGGCFDELIFDVKK